MNEPDIPNGLGQNELEVAQAEAVAGGTLCSAEDLVRITASLTDAYENLVDFASHVIDRVAGN